MPTVVVTGSNNDFRFAVTDFSNTPPTTVYVNPGFGGLPPGPTNNGCVVACSNNLFTDGDISSSLVAVGHYGGSQVAIYDLSNPASPQLQTMFNTGLASIGALSLYGNNLLVGENNPPNIPNIALLDISQPPPHAIVSTIPANDFSGGIVAGAMQITSIAISGGLGLLAVVAGLRGVDVLDYTNNPKSPQILPFDLQSIGLLSTGPYVCDFDGDTAALGDAKGNVAVFAIRSGAGASFIGQSSSVLENITSIAVESGNFIQVAAGSYSNSEVALVSFGGPGPQPPPVTPVLVGGGAGDVGGAVAFYGLPNLFASTNNGRGIIWLNTEVWPSTTVVSVAANANPAPATVSTLGIAYFPTPVRWPWPVRLFPPWWWGWWRDFFG